MTIEFTKEDADRIERMILRIPDFGSKRWLIQDQITRRVYDAWLDRPQANG